MAADDSVLKLLVSSFLSPHFTTDQGRWSLCVGINGSPSLHYLQMLLIRDSFITELLALIL